MFALSSIPMKNPSRIIIIATTVIDRHLLSYVGSNDRCFERRFLRRFLFQRKIISIRPQDTVRDLIKKCIDTAYLRVGDINLSLT